MQFTLARLLASTALIACGIAAATLPWRVSADEFPMNLLRAGALVQLSFWVSFAFIGAGVGTIFKQPWLGAFWGVLAAMFLALGSAAVVT
jgi:hypothetical protein